MRPRKIVLYPKLKHLAGYKVKDLLTKAVQSNQAAQAPKQPKTPQAPKHPIGQVFQTKTPGFCMVTRQDPTDPNSTDTVRASCDPNKAQEGAGEGGQPTQQVTPPEVGQSPVAKTQEGTGEANTQNQGTKEPVTFDNWFEGLTDDTPEEVEQPEGYSDKERLFDAGKYVWTNPDFQNLLPINLTSKRQLGASFQFSERINKSNITDENKVLYRNYMNSVLTNMPDSAIEDIQNNLTDRSTFTNTQAEVPDAWLELYKSKPWFNDPESQEISRAFEKKAEELKEMGAAGLYSPDQGAIIADGGEELARSDYNSFTSRGVYAHELTHAIDGPKSYYSSKGRWRDAFHEELKEGQLCAYAATSELEGFAEFGRLLYAGEHLHEDIKRDFPKSFAFWEKMGLVKEQFTLEAPPPTPPKNLRVWNKKSIKSSPFYGTKSLLRNKSISRRVQGGHYNEQGAFIPDGTPFQSESGECRVIQQTSHRNVPSSGCGTSGRSEVKNPQLTGRREEKTPDFAAQKDQMKTMEIVDIVDLSKEEVGEHKNVTKVVTYSDGSKGVYKPEYGEDPRFAEYNIHGRLYAREAANSDIADLVGMSDLLPSTVVRDVDGQRGSIQHYVDGTLPAIGYGEIEHTDPSTHPDRYIDPFHPRYDGDKDLARAGALDYLTGQQDRHLGNWLLDKNGKLVLIDNGGTFPNSANNSIGPSYLTDVARERNLAIPEEVRHWKWDDIHSILKKYEFSREEIAHTKERFRDLQKSTTFAGLAESMKARLKRDKLEQLRENLRAMRARKPSDPVLSQSQHPAGQEPLAATNLARTNLEKR